MEKFGVLWSNKGSQEPDPGLGTSNAKEEANWGLQGRPNYPEQETGPVDLR